MGITEKRIEWKNRIDARKASEASAAEWCRKHDLIIRQMYYWIKKFKQDDSPIDQEAQPQWLAVNVEETANNASMEAAVFIHVDNISVEVRQGAQMDLVSDIIQVLQQRC